MLQTLLQHAEIISPLNDSSHCFASSFQRDTATSSFHACRIHGHLYVNKVAGNFHITVGKYVINFLKLSSMFSSFAARSSWMCDISLTLFLLLSRSIPHPRGHAHLAALVSHDCKFMKVSQIVIMYKHLYFRYNCCCVSQLIISLTESTTCHLEKTFLAS